MSARQSKVLKAFSSLLQVPSSLSTHPSRHMLHLFPVYPWSESQVQIPVSSSHVIALSMVPSQLQSQPNNNKLYKIKNSKEEIIYLCKKCHLQSNTIHPGSHHNCHYLLHCSQDWHHNHKHKYILQTHHKLLCFPLFLTNYNHSLQKKII